MCLHLVSELINCLGLFLMGQGLGHLPGSRILLDHIYKPPDSIPVLPHISSIIPSSSIYIQAKTTCPAQSLPCCLLRLLLTPTTHTLRVYVP